METEIRSILFFCWCKDLAAEPQICDVIMAGNLKDDFLMVLSDEFGITGSIIGVPLTMKAVWVVPNLRPCIDMESQDEATVRLTRI